MSQFYEIEYLRNRIFLTFDSSDFFLIDSSDSSLNVSRVQYYDWCKDVVFLLSNATWTDKDTIKFHMNKPNYIMNSKLCAMDSLINGRKETNIDKI